ncbi:MAG: DUF5659 domain-containing protein [Candidatus Shapirobacteria bacterium]
MQNRTYKTKDIGVSAMLLTLGIPLIKTQRSGETVFFEFEENEKCKELSNQYWFGNCLVNARDFHQNLGILKGQIFRG